jgi:hypothetical protein
MMDMPMRIASRGETKLVYSIPAWYRAMLVLIALILVSSLFIAEGVPSALGWIFVIVALLSAVYEERWTADSERKTLSHRYGLIFAARSFSLSFDGIHAFRVSSFIKGEMKDPATAENDPDESNGLSKARRPYFKKRMLRLIVETGEGEVIVMDAAGERSRERIEAAAEKFSSFCGGRLE